MYHLHSTSCDADGLALFVWKLWGRLACPLGYFCLWNEMIVEWSGRFLYTGKHAELRGGYAGIFLHKFGVSCQIRICDVTAKMLLVRGKAPETPDNVKWRQILPSLLIYDGIFCRHFWDLTALFAVTIFCFLWMTAFSAVTFLNLTALFDGIWEECRRFLPSYSNFLHKESRSGILHCDFSYIQN